MSEPDALPTRPLPPPGGPQWTGGRLVSWSLMLLLLLLFIMGSTVRLLPNEVAERIRDRIAPQMILQGRYLYGLQAMAAGEGQGEQIRQQLEQLQLQTDSSLEALGLIVLRGAMDSGYRVDSALRASGFDNNVVAPRIAMHLRQLADEGAEALDTTQRQDLQERLGWFAALALLEPDDEAGRSALAQEAMVYTTLFGAAVLAICLALIVGLVCACLACVRFANRQIRLRFVPVADGPSAYLGGFVLYIILFIVWSIGMGQLGLSPVWSWGFLLLLPIVLAFFLLNGVGPAEWFRSVGWHRGTGVAREMGAGLIGYLAGLPLVGLVLLLCMWWGSDYRIHHPVQDLLADPAARIGVFLMAAGFAPLVEETFFRGCLQRHLRSRHSWTFSALVGGLFFAAIHPQGIFMIPALCVLAMVFSALREWRDSLIAPVTAHAVHNGSLVLLSFLIY